MRATRYKRGDWNAADLAVYRRATAGDNSGELAARKRKLAWVLREGVTPRQREILELYYREGKNTREIAQALGLEKSSVARTLRRGEERLRRGLRWAGEEIPPAASRKRGRTRH